MARYKLLFSGVLLVLGVGVPSTYYWVKGRSTSTAFDASERIAGEYSCVASDGGRTVLRLFPNHRSASSGVIEKYQEHWAADLGRWSFKNNTLIVSDIGYWRLARPDVEFMTSPSTVEKGSPADIAYPEILSGSEPSYPDDFSSADEYFSITNLTAVSFDGIRAIYLFGKKGHDRLVSVINNWPEPAGTLFPAS